MNSINKKNILIALVVIMVGLLIVGGTYAYLSISLTVTNGNYATSTGCFNITYTNDTDQITGTLFPSSGPSGGLSDSIYFKTNGACSTNGRGTFYLHVDSASNILTSTVAPHCENKYTLETAKDLDVLDCVGNENTVWVTNGTALKYAIYDSTERNHLYAAGYIDSTFIGQDKAIHTDFSVTSTQRAYYLYIWLDGYVSDDTYTDLPFSATSRLSVTQTKSTDTTFIGDSYTTIDNTIYQYNGESPYQRVEYIRSDGTQCIMMDIAPDNTTGLYARMSSQDVSTDFVYFGSKGSGNSRFWIGNTGGTLYYGWNTYTASSSRPSITKDVVFTLSMNYLNDRKHIFNDSTVVASNIGTLASNPYNLFIFGGNNSTNGNCTPSGKNKITIYEFKISRGSEVIANLIPCYRKSDNVAGLYDIVNGKFYSNIYANGNNFTTGPDVS